MSYYTKESYDSALETMAEEFAGRAEDDYENGDAAARDGYISDAMGLYAEEIEEYELQAQYDELLDDVYGDVSIAGYSYNTSRTLYEIDPTAYRTGFLDWLDSEIQDGSIVEA